MVMLAMQSMMALTSLLSNLSRARTGVPLPELPVGPPFGRCCAAPNQAKRHTGLFGTWPFRASAARNGQVPNRPVCRLAWFGSAQQRPKGGPPGSSGKGTPVRARDRFDSSDVNAIIDCMASITIRGLEPELKERLRVRAARHG